MDTRVKICGINTPQAAEAAVNAGAQYLGFVFFPKTPETLSRIIVESRMMGMKVITNQLPGAVKEEWFKLKGKALVDIMRAKRQEIPNIVLQSFEE